MPNNFNKNNKMARKEWMYGFLKRKSYFNLMKLEVTSLNRVRAFNKQGIGIFFNKWAHENCAAYDSPDNYICDFLS